jgi:hypothetical protein
VRAQLREAEVRELRGEAHRAHAAVHALEHDVRGLDVAVDDLEVVQVLEAA